MNPGWNTTSPFTVPTTIHLRFLHAPSSSLNAWLEEMTEFEITVGVGFLAKLQPTAKCSYHYVMVDKWQNVINGQGHQPEGL